MCSFLKRKLIGSESGVKGRLGKLGGVEGGETVVAVYFMGKESIFNIRNKK